MKGLDDLLQPVAEGLGGKVEDVFDEGERPHLGLLVPTSTLVLLQQTLTQNRVFSGEETFKENESTVFRWYALFIPYKKWNKKQLTQNEPSNQKIIKNCHSKVHPTYFFWGGGGVGGCF